MSVSLKKVILQKFSQSQCLQKYVFWRSELANFILWILEQVEGAGLVGWRKGPCLANSWGGAEGMEDFDP